MRFFKCGDCNSVAMELIEGAYGCSPNYQELTANTTDASSEKHVPVAEMEGDILTVKVGSIEHPMFETHYIMCIYVETDKGGFLQKLSPQDAPEAVFQIPQGQKVLAVYEYCNLHGLWKCEFV